MNSIKMEKIRKTYNGNVVLKDIDFCFEQNLFYVITGPSGCGKTTLLNILNGYISPDSGRVISDLRIEYLFQDEMLFSNLSVEENMKIRFFAKNNSLENSDVIICETLQKFNIEHLLKNKIAVLSGGERQRVELAGILLTQSDVVLLDEPTARLDGDNKNIIIENISTAFAGKMLIVVTHEKEFFKNDFISLRLEKGEIVYEG